MAGKNRSAESSPQLAMARPLPPTSTGLTTLPAAEALARMRRSPPDRVCWFWQETARSQERVVSVRAGSQSRADHARNDGNDELGRLRSARSHGLAHCAHRPGGDAWRRRCVAVRARDHGRQCGQSCHGLCPVESDGVRLRLLHRPPGRRPARHLSVGPTAESRDDDVWPDDRRAQPVHRLFRQRARSGRRQHLDARDVRSGVPGIRHVGRQARRPRSATSPTCGRRAGRRW